MAHCSSSGHGCYPLTNGVTKHCSSHKIRLLGTPNDQWCIYMVSATPGQKWYRYILPGTCPCATSTEHTSTKFLPLCMCVGDTSTQLRSASPKGLTIPCGSVLFLSIRCLPPSSGVVLAAVVAAAAAAAGQSLSCQRTRHATCLAPWGGHCRWCAHGNTFSALLPWATTPFALP